MRVFSIVLELIVLLQTVLEYLLTEQCCVFYFGAFSSVMDCFVSVDRSLKSFYIYI